METMTVIRKSPVTGKINTMELDITDSELESYYNGALVQEAFPRLNADEREFFLTGFTPEDWESVFGSGE